MKTLLFVGCLLGVLCCPPASSQNSSAQKAGSVARATFDPTQTSNAPSPTTQLTLEGTKDTAIAKARVGVQLGSLTLEGKVSTPVNGATGNVESVTLDGLSTKSTADFGISKVFFHASAQFGPQKEVCIDYLLENNGLKRSDALDVIDKGKELADGTRFVCGLEALHGHWLLEYKANEHISLAKIITARFKIGRETYEYALPSTFIEDKTTKSSYAGTLALGAIFPATGLTQLSYQYQNSYKAADIKNICSPILGSASQACRDVATGLPSRTIKSIVGLEIRKFYSTSFGINPQIMGDLKGRAASIQVPFYIFKSKDGGLNGGFSVAWRSDTKAFSGTVFVGDIFTILSK